MAGIIAIAIDKGHVQTKIEINDLNVLELSLVSAQLRIMEMDITKEIKRMTRVK